MVSFPLAVFGAGVIVVTSSVDWVTRPAQPNSPRGGRTPPRAWTPLLVNTGSVNPVGQRRRNCVVKVEHSVIATWKRFPTWRCALGPRTLCDNVRVWPCRQTSRGEKWLWIVGKCLLSELTQFNYSPKSWVAGWRIPIHSQRPLPAHALV
jgi:hypothetical protein